MTGGPGLGPVTLMGNEVTEQVIRLDGGVKNLHGMADDPFEVIMARLGVVSLEPTGARERVAVCVEGIDMMLCVYLIIRLCRTVCVLRCDVRCI